MVEEIELKLELTPDGASALEAAQLFGSEPQVRHLTTTYFDTPEYCVRQSGFSLRIRHVGRTKIETVKANGTNAAGLFARPEWERKVKGDTPLLDDSTPLAPVLGDKAGQLTAMFTISVTRRTWNMTVGDAAMEIVLDRGKIVAQDRETPICEVEIEQKSGKLSELFALARRIDALAPVRLGVLSKGERGYRLLAPAIFAVKSERIPIDADMCAAEAFQQIAQACLRHFRLNEQQLLQRNDPEVLHQARVALRRLRSAFSIHKAMCGDSEFTRLGDELRWLQAELGNARDLDVLHGRAPPGRVRDSIERARNQAYVAVNAALASDRTRMLMIDLAAWISTGDWLRQPATERARTQPSRQFAAEALDRFRKKVKKGGRNIEKLDDPERHQVRKAAKKLRYSAEFFAALFGRKREAARQKHFVAALNELQDQLGALNDLVTAREVLNRLGLENDPMTAPLLATGAKPELLEAAADACDAMVDAKRFW